MNLLERDASLIALYKYPYAFLSTFGGQNPNTPHKSR